MRGNIRLLSLSILLSLSLYSCASPTTASPTSEKSYSIPQSEDIAVATMASPSASASQAPTSLPSASATQAPTPSAGLIAPNVSSDMLGSQNKVAISNPILPEEEKLKNNVFKDYGLNNFVSTQKDTLSTFGLDVDTASYTWMRKSVLNNFMVSKDSVRTEEYINYFDYDYIKPNQDNKFSITTDLFKVKDTNVLKIGVQGLKIDNSQRKNAHISLVIDISGSMNQENRLALVKESVKILVKSLTDKDFISITVFGNQARTLLSYSNDKEKIINIIDDLKTEGATNTEAGLNLGYTVAKQNYKTGYINKVILCSDGYANIGSTNPDILLNKIKQDAISGISLSTIGFGMGNYNDVLMEQLADKGDGSYSYVDTLKEADRIFTQNLTGTIQTIAKDAKMQVAFNPDIVSEYRLIGYENRDIADDDFRNDKVDSGDVGSGQSVTALYELKFKTNMNTSSNLANIFLRYKDIDQNLAIKEVSKDIKINDLVLFEQANNDSKLALSSAIYAEILKGSYWSQMFNFDNVIEYSSKIAQSEKVKDFISLVNKAKTLNK
jgi:Ca-activated chloride channel family protein